jgi:hypothetical protein
MSAIPRFLAPSILKSSQRGKFAPEPFELDEVTPKMATEERLDDSGNKIMGNDGTPRKFNTDEIIGYKYSVTILEGEHRKKSTQITVAGLNCPINNAEIMKRDSVKCRFTGLEPSMVGNPIYYKAEKIELVAPQAK